MSRIAAALDHRTRLTALMRQSLFANAGYMLGITLVGSLAGFVFWGMAARLYQPQEVGIASSMASAVALLANIASLGVSIGLVRFLPETPHPSRLLNTSLAFNTATGILAGGAFLVGLPLWLPSLVILQRHALHAVGFLVYVIATTLGALIHAAFVARRQALYALIQPVP